VHFSDLSGDLMDADDVNSKTLPGGQGLAGKLQQDAFECDSQRMSFGARDLLPRICILSQVAGSDGGSDGEITVK